MIENQFKHTLFKCTIILRHLYNIRSQTSNKHSGVIPVWNEMCGIGTQKFDFFSSYFLRKSFDNIEAGVICYPFKDHQ